MVRHCIVPTLYSSFLGFLPFLLDHHQTIIIQLIVNPHARLHIFRYFATKREKKRLPTIFKNDQDLLVKCRAVLVRMPLERKVYNSVCVCGGGGRHVHLLEWPPFCAKMVLRFLQPPLR